MMRGQDDAEDDGDSGADAQPVNAGDSGSPVAASTVSGDAVGRYRKTATTDRTAEMTAEM